MKLIDISRLLRSHIIKSKSKVTLFISALLTMFTSFVYAEEAQVFQEKKTVATFEVIKNEVIEVVDEIEVIKIYAMRSSTTHALRENKTITSDDDATPSAELGLNLASN